MGLTELIFKGPVLAEVSTLILDATVRELHRVGAKPTRHPIEAEDTEQATVSDHVQVEPLSIQIEGVVSGTPVLSIADLVERSQGGSNDPVKEAHQLVTEMVREGRLVDVVTTLRNYTSMVIESAEVPRDANKGNDLYISLTLTEVRLVSLEEIEVQAAAAPQATKTKGKKAPKEASEPVQVESQSILSKGLDAAAGWFR
jgi:hypothetical protein